MKSFSKFIIEGKGPIDITGPDGKPTKKSEKFLRNLKKKGALNDPELSPIQKRVLKHRLEGKILVDMMMVNLLQ